MHVLTEIRRWMYLWLNLEWMFTSWRAFLSKFPKIFIINQGMWISQLKPDSKMVFNFYQLVFLVLFLSAGNL